VSVLPQGWARCQIGEATRIVSGGTPPSKEPLNFQNKGGVSWVTPADLSGYRGMYISCGARNLSDVGYEACSALKMPPGTVLFSSRAPIGYVAIAENEISTNQGFKNFVLPATLESRFVYQYLRHIKPIAESVATGTTFKELSGSAAAKLPLLVAPLAEQKRIADKLDTVLARVDACRERLDRVLLILKRFRRSVLSAAISGQLTVDWREKNIAISHSTGELIQEARDELSEYLLDRKTSEKKAPIQPDLTNWEFQVPATWITCSVNQFAECLDRLRVPIKREDRKSGKGLFPYYGANGEVGRIDDFIFDDELVLVTEDETFYGREKPIAYRSSGKCWVNNHAHVLRPRTKDAADYLCYALMYYDVIPWLSGTTGRAKLTQAALNALPIAMPPKLEQAEIIRRVQTLFAFADGLETRLATARTATDRLTPALLAKAFRGELVPQDPNDEPASELLKRLAAQREAAPKTARARKAAAI
jgi:type I restriction enzyme, S subunit